jgi:hypothetical protein
MPRMKAIPTASPAAPAKKFCDTRPSAWVRYRSVDSPAFACQVVVVTKLIAVFAARSTVIGVVR